MPSPAILVVFLTFLLVSPVAYSENSFFKKEWRHLQSANFTVITDAKAPDANALITDLELFRSVVLKMTNAQAGEQRTPTTALLFRTIGDFQKVTRSKRTAGYMRPGLRGNYMARQPQMANRAPVLASHIGVPEVMLWV